MEERWRVLAISGFILVSGNSFLEVEKGAGHGGGGELVGERQDFLVGGGIGGLAEISLRVDAGDFGALDDAIHQSGNLSPTA